MQIVRLRERRFALRIHRAAEDSEKIGGDHGGNVPSHLECGQGNSDSPQLGMKLIL